ncbi:MAG: LCP family protein [Thermoleophilaceae bacterium]|nr:LCP family protein [Thermoleophilaceae bacterium]
MFDDQESQSPKRRFIYGSLLLVVVAALVSSVMAFAARDSVLPQAIAGIAPTPKYEGGPQTVLLIGADTRKGDKKLGVKARSDTMMLVRLDPDNNVTTVLSIPRDLRVKIPGHGTDKFNASYSYGGTKLVMETIKDTFGIEVQRVAEVDFHGFAQAVDAVDCVYVDVDRKYFNNNVGKVYADQFAAINIKAGYQKLCGYRALDYVRFRHYDDDMYREARQQGFLRQAKQQVGVGNLLTNASKLSKVVNRNIRTDRWLTSGANFQKFLRLAAESSGKPVFQVAIPNSTTPTIGGASYVVASNASMKKAADVFLEGPRQKGANHKADAAGSDEKPPVKRAKRSGNLPASMSYAKDAGKKQAFFASVGINLPVFYPTALVNGASYVDTSTRGYRMTKPDGKRVSAYRIVAKMNSASGEYYGVQGVNWDDPPILKNPSESRKIGGRTYDLYYEGNKLALVAFHRDGASYWVANTLLRKLKEREMLALAQSLRVQG